MQSLKKCDGGPVLDAAQRALEAALGIEFETCAATRDRVAPDGGAVVTRQCCGRQVSVALLCTKGFLQRIVPDGVAPIDRVDRLDVLPGVARRIGDAVLGVPAGEIFIDAGGRELCRELTYGGEYVRLQLRLEPVRDRG